MGKKADDGHLGTTKVPLALQATQCSIVLQTRQIGGTNQLLWQLQSNENASTPADLGVTNLELKQASLVLLLSANLSQTYL